MGCHFLLQTIFPAQESNPGLPHCRQTLYCLSRPEQVASLCPMIKDADSEPSSPHTALLGRKAGQAGALFLLWSPAFQRRRAGVLGRTPRLRGAQAGLRPSGGRHSGPRRCRPLPPLAARWRPDFGVFAVSFNLPEKLVQIIAEQVQA